MHRSALAESIVCTINSTGRTKQQQDEEIRDERSTSILLAMEVLLLFALL